MLFFFFQAEDGIRDGHVTGVQTCALPIFSSGVASGTGRVIGAPGRVTHRVPARVLGTVGGVVGAVRTVGPVLGVRVVDAIRSILIGLGRVRRATGRLAATGGGHLVAPVGRGRVARLPGR